MIFIKNKILITVTYLVEAEKDGFWNKETGDLLSYQIIHHPKANLLTCPVCKRLITDTTKPKPIPTIRQAKELGGVLMCSSCVWELEYDWKGGRNIEEILEQFK